MPRSESLGSYLDALASAAPTPGGGASAAWTLAQSAALLCMVCRLTQGKPHAVPHEETLRLVLIDALAVKDAAERLADADSLAFSAFGAAASMPKDTPTAEASRFQALQTALDGAARVPLAVHELASHLLKPGGAMQTLTRIGNPRVLSDVGVARHLALAARLASVENIQVNLTLLKDASLAAPLRVRLARSESVLDKDEEEGAEEMLLADPGAHAKVDAILREVPGRLFTTPSEP